MMQHRSVVGELIEIRDFATAKQDKQRRSTALHIHHLSMASSRIADDYPELAGWYCLQVKDQREFSVEKELIDAGVFSLVVRQGGEEVIRRGRKWLLPERPWLRGYVLVRCVPSPSAFAGLLSIKDVFSIVGGLERPYKIPDRYINVFKDMVGSLSEAKKEKKAAEGEFMEGQRLRIVDGPFASFEAVVTETIKKDGERVKCEVSIFGRLSPMDLPLASVEKV
ncbi:transcription termination/antitermination protein NusG [Agrobacterium vitis]|uniref:transcription termination/antitermination protein NusG n=1 Tax=Agrobacterium vitis TaxID=373 RepID=UPI0018D3721A|nr:transcription termination/antitermination NusG family protein [Agrobacterium vitis]